MRTPYTPQGNKAFPRNLANSAWISALILIAVLGYAYWSYSTGGIIAVLLSYQVEPHYRLDAIRAYFISWGSLAPLLYLFIVTIEVVVAPIPGTLLYLPGGILFGWALGGSISLIGNVVGAGLSCYIARILGRTFLDIYFDTGSLKPLETELVGYPLDSGDPKM